MKTLDSLLLQFFQSLSDWFQNWFGANNFFLAKGFLILSWISFLAQMNIEMTKIGNFGHLVLGCVIQTFITVMLLPLVNWSERSCQINPNFKNRCEKILYILRIFQVLAVIILTIDFTFNYVWGVNINIPVSSPISFEKLSRSNEIISRITGISFDIFFGLFLYFGSCTPKPPKQGRLSELLEKLVPQPLTS